ncbi:pyridoxamine 5'-phosphate oxidase family protein [Pseudodesulfovibrio sp.]|uniref:pyridoxamine 5'-phosphate oxidase family protein n=1 Tax=Pseudodesulfovibrio sp. TaxID=2035812 RepID=UPI002607FE62|nr:pyridoxamine 5'-phosphate oxidase family protein [Pseudodesulfovibrio sp.]MDD3313144.1 pyridoxamine 5'-phosphate oxidase family protein [Pseudodesulfovibrio sp.]
MSTEKLQLIDDLVLGNDICVLATSDGFKPHASLMHYFVDHAAMKFYFLSLEGSRKSRNLIKCPHVSMVIDRRSEGKAVTIEGVHSPVQRRQTVEAITHLFVLRHPQLKEFAERPDTRLIRIEARGAQLVDIAGESFFTKFQNS